MFMYLVCDTTNMKNRDYQRKQGDKLNTMAFALVKQTLLRINFNFITSNELRKEFKL